MQLQPNHNNNDMTNFTDLVRQYLEFVIAEDFNMCVKIANEIIFTENIVSEKIVVVQNFSEQINRNIELKNFLVIVIYNINVRMITAEDMHRTLQD
jgi:hypothetical protein